MVAASSVVLAEGLPSQRGMSRGPDSWESLEYNKNPCLSYPAGSSSGKGSYQAMPAESRNGSENGEAENTPNMISE